MKVFFLVLVVLFVKGVGNAADCSGVIKRLQSIDKTVNCGTGGSVYGSTVIAAVVTFSVCIVILSHFYYLESNSSCEDQTNTNLRVLAMKRESRTICSWNITAPEFNRVWVRISVLDSKEENSTVCPNYLKLEEIKDNQKSLLKRYCTPVDRDYIKSNSSKILVTAYNIKFKISWNGFERKKKTGVDADENHAVTEKTIAQTTNSVNEDKTSHASYNERNFLRSSFGLLMVCVIGFVIKKRCCKRSYFPANHEIYKMNNMQTNTTIELDDHGKLQMATQGNGTINLQKTSKKTQRNSEVCNSKINGIDKKNKTDGKSQTQGRSWGKKENHPTNRRRERPGSSKEEHIYSNTNFTDVEKDNYWCLETPYVNHLQKEVFSDVNEKTNQDACHSSTSSLDSEDYVNMN